MQRIGRILKHNLQSTPESATFMQCQTVWALMEACQMQPIWVDKMNYGKAVLLINRLRALLEEQRARQ